MVAILQLAPVMAALVLLVLPTRLSLVLPLEVRYGAFGNILLVPRSVRFRPEKLTCNRLLLSELLQPDCLLPIAPSWVQIHLMDQLLTDLSFLIIFRHLGHRLVAR
jgi:hypothetical protein